MGLLAASRGAAVRISVARGAVAFAAESFSPVFRMFRVATSYFLSFRRMRIG